MNSQSRSVRVFLSSTFRDFAEERDLLVRKVFPELRRKCRERQVELVDVDLRWGITEEEAQQGKVLPICLAEIDRSRPFFMGFIGDRYGWVPEKDQYNLSLIMEQSWLDEHRGVKSVTELEMLHGVLNNPAMEDRAFFYFRDSAYSQAKGGAYLSEGSEESAKLEALKDRIRKSGFPVLENYPSPEALAERVREDLWKLIDEAYPESEVPDALTQERMRHEAYGSTRLRLYLGGENYFKALDEAIKAKPFRPILITGQSGGGKSALVANWVARWSAKHPKTAVIVHHLGCGADAADPVRMAVRLMREISRLTGDEFKPESDPEKQLEQLPQWLALASAWAQRSKRELLIVLDGLDKVSERQHLRWFPGFLPPNVKLVASCLDGEILEAAKGRLNWQELTVKPFTKTEQKRFIGEYLGRYRKSLTAKQTKTLQSHQLSGNPLFLLTVLEELRVFGVHEELEQRMRTLLSPPQRKGEDEAPTVDDVFEHVLARIEQDLGKKSVQQAMEALWASRAGLYQDELLAIAMLAPARWAAIQNALDESLYESSGRISFGHDYLRKAVEDRYGLSGKTKLKLHRRLAQWFEEREADARVAEELPWQYSNANELTPLKKFLINLDNFLLLLKLKEGIRDALSYWKRLGGESFALDYVNSLKISAYRLCSLDLADTFLEFFELAGWDRLGLSAAQAVWPMAATCSSATSIASLSARMTHFLISNGRYNDAADAIKGLKIRGSYQENLEATSPRVLMLECKLCSLFDDPRWLFGQALSVVRKLYSNIECLSIADRREAVRAKLDAAKLVYESVDHRDRGWMLLDDCLRDAEKLLGSNDPINIEVKLAIGRALMDVDSDYSFEAEEIVQQAYTQCLSLFGPESVQTHRCQVLLGRILVCCEETEPEGRNMLLRSAKAIEQYYGPMHLETADAFEYCSKAEAICCRYREAACWIERSLEIRRVHLNEGHPKVRWFEYDRACYQCLSGNTEEAKRLIAEHLRLHPELKGQALADKDFSVIKDFIQQLL